MKVVSKIIISHIRFIKNKLEKEGDINVSNA